MCSTVLTAVRMAISSPTEGSAASCRQMKGSSETPALMTAGETSDGSALAGATNARPAVKKAPVITPRAYALMMAGRVFMRSPARARTGCGPAGC